MTNRVNGLTITLDKDYREDDIETLISAIYMLKGVMKVETHIANHEHNFLLERYNYKMRDRILQLFNQINKEII